MLTWDRTHDWVLERYWRDLTRVTIQFRRRPPSVIELAALRRCLPQYRHMAPAELRAVTADSDALPLGVMPTPEARQLIAAAEAQGLQVLAEGASYVSYLPINRTTGCAWRIEDDAESVAVVEAMLAAGVPVQMIEA